MKKICIMLGMFFMLICTSVVALAIPIQSGENSHWYEAVFVSEGINWEEANARATNVGGYLATITSQEENNFVFNLVSGISDFWVLDPVNNEGPWLGGYQLAGSIEPGGGWNWVTGEAFSYTNWGNFQPNNSGAGADQNRLNFFGVGNTRTSIWNDVQAGFLSSGYIVEHNANPVPEPSTILFLGFGFMGLVAWRYKHHGKV